MFAVVYCYDTHKFAAMFSQYTVRHTWHHHLFILTSRRILFFIPNYISLKLQHFLLVNYSLPSSLPVGDSHFSLKGLSAFLERNSINLSWSVPVYLTFWTNKISSHFLDLIMDVKDFALARFGCEKQTSPGAHLVWVSSSLESPIAEPG